MKFSPPRLEECLEIAEFGQSLVWDIRSNRFGVVYARIEIEFDRLPNKAHGRAQASRLVVVCLVENPARHF